MRILPLGLLFVVTAVGHSLKQIDFIDVPGSFYISHIASRMVIDLYRTGTLSGYAPEMINEISAHHGKSDGPGQIY